MSKETTRGYVRAAKRSRICCHDSPHDEAVDPRLRPFHTVSEGVFSEVRKSLAAVRVLVVFARVLVFAATQGFLSHGVDEPPDEGHPGEDIDRREDLAERGVRGRIPEAHGRQRGDAEVEGIHHAPILYRVVESAPANKHDDDEDRQGAELGVPPPSPNDSV
jgi:hypothetical protein